MSRFIETIRLQDGRFGNLDFHQLRIDESTRKFYGPEFYIDVKEFLSTCPMPAAGLHKIKLVYDSAVLSVEITPYRKKEVNQLKIVYDNAISYSHKFENRTAIESLFGQRDGCDDIIIIKNYQVTDASYANLIFRRNGQWFTPKAFLLNGTARKQLLERKIIVEEKITINDLQRYEKVKLINAMLLLDGPEIDVSQIVG